MRTLLRKIGFGLLAAVVTVLFAVAPDLAGAAEKSNSNKPTLANPQSNQVQPISSFAQASNAKDKDKDKDKDKHKHKHCASPPCKHDKDDDDD